MPGETIERAAIKRGMKIFDVPRPGRHHDVINLMRDRGYDLAACERQGFTTSSGRFVNRREAMKIAKAAGQLIAEPRYRDTLFSEDIF